MDISSEEDAPPIVQSSRKSKKRKRGNLYNTIEKKKNEILLENSDEKEITEIIEQDEKILSNGKDVDHNDDDNEDQEDIDNDDNDDDGDEDEDEDQEDIDNDDDTDRDDDDRDNDEEEDIEDYEEDIQSPIMLPAKKKKGIIYISRIPPGMSPSKLKSILLKSLPTHSSNGTPTIIGRIYLEPEDTLISKARAARLSKKKTRRLFTEGWIELPNRKLAKRAAETLNGELMISPSYSSISGSKKSKIHRDPYVDDLWVMKYLPNFTWDDLTSQLATERASRREREMKEIQRSKKEAEGYIQAVSKAKMIEKIREKKKINSKNQESSRGIREFSQRKLVNQKQSM